VCRRGHIIVYSEESVREIDHTDGESERAKCDDVMMPARKRRKARTM